MRPDEPPCFECPDQGCGRHATCKKYMKYYAANRRKSQKKLADGAVDDYTKHAVEKMKSGRHCTADRYRPKGRW